MYNFNLDTPESAIEALTALLPEGATVFTTLRHVSASGMSRYISAWTVVNGEPYSLDYLMRLSGLGVAQSNRHAHPGLYVSGVGMDTGYHVVYSLARFLYGDGYTLKHRWF